MAGPDDPTEDLMLFEYEHFQAPFDYPFYEIEPLTKPEIEIGPLEK